MNATFQPDGATHGRPDFSDRHIVHVVRQYPPSVGGLEDVVRNLAVRQKDRFASVKVVTLDRLFTDPGTVLPHEDVIDGVAVERIPYFGSSRYPVAPGVWQGIREADLVHVHAVDFFFDALALTRFLHRRRLVATTHGGFFHTRKFARLKSIWFNTLTRFSTSQYEALACCSASDLEMFRGIAPRKSRLIENGVAIEKFHDASARQPQKRLLTLGRFSANKRLDRLIGLIAGLVASDPQWHLDIAGMESDLTRSELLGLARANGVAANVNVHVGLSDQGLRELMGHCSLFVSASEYEGFGLALIEALSAGLLPVVHENEAYVSLARQHPVIRTVDFADGRKALEAVEAAWAALAADGTLRAGAMDAAQGFSWAAKSLQYDDLYRKALAG